MTNLLEEMMRHWIFMWATVLAVGCSTAPVDGAGDTLTSHGDTATSEGICGHQVDPEVVNFGFNIVVDASDAPQSAQGRPLQEGWRLEVSPEEVEDHNSREYARIASFMMPIRDALMCNIATLDEAQWLSLTQVLTLNDIRREQDLSGTPPERVYSTEGIYELLKAGEDFHPMMKYLEEAELELKCIAFQGFDFTNPEGDDHCAIHGLPVGQGLNLP